MERNYKSITILTNVLIVISVIKSIKLISFVMGILGFLHNYFLFKIIPYSDVTTFFLMYISGFIVGLLFYLAPVILSLFNDEKYFKGKLRLILILNIIITSISIIRTYIIFF